MPTITHTDYLLQVSGTGLVAVPGVWVRLLNNSTATNYYSTAVTTSTGAFTHSAVPGDYSAFYGTAATVPGTPTLANAHWAVPVTAGDDAVLGSATLVVSSPYVSTAVAGGEDFSGAVRITGGRPWVDPTHPTFGGKWDAQKVTDGVLTAASGVVTSASGLFKSTDVGKVMITTRGGAQVTNPTIAISGADGGAGGSTLPVGTYHFAYTWRAFDGETTVGSSDAAYVQGTGNHIITLTLPATPAGARCAAIYCVSAPGGAFTGQLIETAGTSYAYTAGLTANAGTASASNTTGAPATTTIASYQNANQITTTATATNSATGASVIWGTDDQAANIAAYNALKGVGTGILKLPQGACIASVGPTINAPGISIEGTDSYGSTIYYTGAGDCLRVQMSPFTNFVWPGRLQSFAIDGTGAAAGASGLHYGDCVGGLLVDLRVSNFRGTGSKGIWMDNRTNWTESVSWYKVRSYHNTTDVLFDVNGGTTSFDHTSIVDLYMDVETTGLALQNGAILGYGTLNVTGSTGGGSTFLDIRDTAALGYWNLPLLCSISCETPGVATGLKMAAGAWLSGVGYIDFGAGPLTSSNANTTNSNIQFSPRFNCPGIRAMVLADGQVTIGNTTFLPAVGARITAQAADTGLVGFTLTSNGVNWIMDHRGSLNSNQFYLGAGGNPHFVMDTNGNIGGSLHLYPGAEAGGQQTLGGLLHATGVPGNGNGNNKDWIVADNGHQYFKNPSAVWSDYRLRTVQTPTEAVLVSGADMNLGEIVKVTLTAARVVGAPLNPVSGQGVTYVLIQGGAGAFAATWNAVFKGITGGTSGATGTRASFNFEYDGTNWNLVGAQPTWIA